MGVGVVDKVERVTVLVVVEEVVVVFSDSS
jgi:hypothetical protein